MLKRQLKHSSQFSEEVSNASLLAGNPEKDMDALDKMEAEDEENLEEVVDTEEIESEEGSEEVPPEDAEEIPDHLETDLEEPEEEFKDINEKVVVYLYRGFAEIGDNARIFIEDEENEERDPELVEYLKEFMEGYPEVMDSIKEIAKKYVTSIELFDPEEEEVVSGEEPEEENLEEVEDEISDEEIEDELEDKEVVESYIKEHSLEHKIYENDYEIYVTFASKEAGEKFESELKRFKGAEVFKHEDIGEIHAFIRVK